MYLVLVIILVLFLLGALPQNGFHDFGWAPSGGIGLVLLILLILFLMGRL